MMKTFLFALLVAGLACGGKSKPVTTQPPIDPIPMTEPTTPVATEPTTSVEPTKPTEPPPPDPAKVKAELLAAETAAFENAKPVFDKYCAKCHSKKGSKWSQKKLDHFDMTTYPFGGHHAMEVSGEIRETLGLTGKPPTMPFDKKGAVKGEDLELIKAWADAFDASHKGGAHEGHSGGHKH